MFQRDHTQNCLHFWGEGGETSAKQRFLTQLFSAKSRAEISPDGENRVGRRSEQATDFFKEKIGAVTTAKLRRGWGPRKSLLFWGEGGETSAKQRFLIQLFSAKSRAEISPDGENRVGRRSEQRRLQSPEGAGPPKMPAFLGRRRRNVRIADVSHPTLFGQKQGRNFA